MVARRVSGCLQHHFLAVVFLAAHLSGSHTNDRPLLVIILAAAVCQVYIRFIVEKLTPATISVKMVLFPLLWLQTRSLFRCNFASDKNENIMNRKTELPEDLCADEAVCFIADHHITPQQLLCYFLFGEIPANAAAPVRAAIPLEPNEIEILKGLSEKVND